MHTINRTCILALAREKLFATDSTGDDVAHQWVPFWQVSSEVHLLPLVFLLDAEAGEAKI